MQFISAKSAPAIDLDAIIIEFAAQSNIHAGITVVALFATAALIATGLRRVFG